MSKRTLERKLFGWLLAVALVPALVLLLAGVLAGSRMLEVLGTLGPWAEIAESGRSLTDAIEGGEPDSVVAREAARHRAQLSESLRQAGRWGYLEERMVAAVPVGAAIIAVAILFLALLLARQLARQLARPIADLVRWTADLGEGRSPPAPVPDERAEPVEIAALRGAMRTAAAEIADSRARALEAERTKAWGEMARRIAHEMKNPLTPLRLAAYRLESGAGDGNTTLREATAVIRQETDRLDELARSFALIGRPVTGPAAEVDLAELLGMLLRTDVPETLVTKLEAPGAPIVLGHHDALTRAFRNILRNAVEATARSTRPGRITVRITPREHDVEIAIADNGEGIPAGMADIIFEPDRTLKAGGTGLGLAIVQQVVATHGGTVLARNGAEGGAEFVVVLPRQHHAGIDARNTPGGASQGME